MLSMEKRIRAASGQEPADLVLKNARFLNVFTQKFETGDIAITGDEIVGVHDSYEGHKVIDLKGQTIVPGFIDTHRHVESNLTTEIDRAILPRGVTTLFWDPHEMANVGGIEAIKYALQIAQNSPMDMIVNLPSCVPAVAELGTAGAILEIEDLKPFTDDPRVRGLAELMNIGGVLGQDPKVLAKAKAFENVHIDGHLPGITGKLLAGMIASGVSTDHESTSLKEAQDKLAKGVHVFARAGSAAQNVPALAKLFNTATAHRTAFCTDDRNPDDIVKKGDIDYAIRTAIENGVDPAVAYTAASYGAANAFGLTRRTEKFGAPRGAIAPGWKADFVVLDYTKICQINSVYKNGELVTDAMFDRKQKLDMPLAYNTVKVKEVTPADFIISARKPGANAETVTAIGIIEGQIVTKPKPLILPIEEGLVQANSKRDIAKMAVLERHGINGNIGLGFLTGFGFNPGDWALGSTVSHDDHNLVVAGTSDKSMAVAANHLRDIGGGYVLVKDGAVVADLPLPLFGLMSNKHPEEVAKGLRTLLDTTQNVLGGKLHDPFQTLAFLSLSVIPSIKLTDKGLTMFDPAAGDHGPHLMMP